VEQLKRERKNLDFFSFFSLASRGGGAYPFAGPEKVSGALAQLVEHLHGMQGVSGSNPLRSTIFRESGKWGQSHRTMTGPRPVFLSNRHPSYA
jgi:hypothetical protein